MPTRARIAGLAVALLAAVVAAPANASVPAGMTPQQYEAMMVRARALNVLYGLGKPAGMTDAQYRAELIRGAGMNERYGLPVSLTSDEIARFYGTGAVAAPAPVAPVAVPGNGFDWTDATIGAGVASGLFLLGAAGALTVRHRHVGHLPH